MTDAPLSQPVEAARATRSIEPVRVAPPLTAALPTEPPAPPPAVRPVVARVTPAAPGFWIQVGAFRNATTAGRVAEQVRGEILVAPASGSTDPMLRVRVGPFANRAQAVARLREFQGLGYQPFVAAER
jgi:rare lipoprotein A